MKMVSCEGLILRKFAQVVERFSLAAGKENECDSGLRPAPCGAGLATQS